MHRCFIHCGLLAQVVFLLFSLLWQPAGIPPAAASSPILPAAAQAETPTLAQIASPLQAASAADMDGWLWNPSTGHYYGYYADWDQGDWNVAENHAVSLGGHLVTINDAAEEMWLCDVLYLPEDPERGTWTGFNNMTRPGEWSWASGEPITYTNWLPGNPGNTWGIPTHAAALRYCGPGRGWAELRSDGISSRYVGHDYVVERNTGPVGEALAVSGSAAIDGQPLTVGGLIQQGQALAVGDGGVVIDAGNPRPGRAPADRLDYFQVQHEVQKATRLTFPGKLEIQITQGTVKTTAKTWSYQTPTPPVSIHTPDGLAQVSDGQVLSIVTPPKSTPKVEGYTTFILTSGSFMTIFTADGQSKNVISSPCYAVDVTGSHLSDPYPYSPYCGGPVELAKLVVGKPYYNFEFLKLPGGKGWENGRNLAPSDVPALDCSGLVRWAYNKASGATTYKDRSNTIYGESASEQYLNDIEHIQEIEMQPGDLIFFDFPYTDAKGVHHDQHGYASHVVMFIGNDEIISAQSFGSSVSPGVVARLSYSDYMRSRRKYLYGGGFAKVKKAPRGFRVQAHSPVDLVVTDAQGNTIDHTTYTFTEEELIRGIPGKLFYNEWDIDADGELDAAVEAPFGIDSQYAIQVVPHPDAPPDARYGLDVEINGKTTVLAADTPIADIPQQGYTVEVTYHHLFLPSLIR